MQKQLLHKPLKNKLIKIAGFVLLGFAGLVIIVLTAANIYLQNNKNKILEGIKDAFAKNERGFLQIGSVDIAVWTNFPNIAVNLQNVTVSDSLKHTPLLLAKEISCRISLTQLLTKNPDLDKLKISGGLFHLFVDSSGFDNAYLLSPKKRDTSASTATSQSKSFIIHKIELENFQFISEQALNRKRFDVTIHTANAVIRREDSLLLITVAENCLIGGLGFNMNRGSFLENTNVKADWRMQFNKNTKLLEISETPVEINKNRFRISAAFGFGKPGEFRLHAVADNILYRDAAAVLTKNIQSKLTFAKITKPVAVDALLKGSLTEGGDPSVYVTCNAVNTVMKTEFASFDSCNFTGVYNNQVDSLKKPSDPNSIVFFQRFSGKWAGLEMIGDSIRIDNLSEPVFSFNFRSQCSFQKLDGVLNLHKVSFKNGYAKLGLQYKGPLIINYSMFSNITGTLHFEDGIITYVPHNLNFENCNGDIAFSKNNIIIKKITCNYKTNKFIVTGSGNSFNNILMATGRTGVVCNIFCPAFNAGDFKTVFAKESTAPKSSRQQSFGSTISGMDDILSKGDIQLNIKANELRLDNFTAQNANVSLQLEQNDWYVKQAAVNFEGGNILLNATVHRTGYSFLADAKLDIKNADVKKAFYAFNNFGQTGITADNLRGTVNSSFALQMQLDNNGGIVPGTMQGTAAFSITNGQLINYKPLQEIQKYALKNRDFANVSFAEIKNNLTIQKDQLLIPRMEISSTAMRIFVEGVYGIDTATTDISIQVPLSNLSNKSAIITPDNKGADAKAGPSVYLRARSRADGKIKLGIDLFRKFRKSKVED